MASHSAKETSGPVPRNPRHILELRRKVLGSSLQLFYHDAPLKIVRANGQYMYDDQNEAYLDCINNVCHVGHCNPTVVQALCQQIGILNTNSRFLHDNIITLAERLVATMPEGLDTCYFVNSGSEANDLALRLARAYTKQKDMVVLDHAYHGHTQALIGISPYKYNGKHPESEVNTTHVASVPDSYRGKYRHPEYSHDQIAELYAKDVSDIVEELKAEGKGVCGFIAESLQSCGGQIIPPKGYFSRVYDIIQSAGGVCIADEVQVGFGRVGTHMWAFQMHNDEVKPDIVTMGKPMGNGHPVAALITRREISDAMEMEYFNTYGGNPVSCAAALAVLDVIENDKLLKHAVNVGDHLTSHLYQLMDRFEIIGDIRAAGMFVGIDLVLNRETREPVPSDLAKYIVYRMKEQKILISQDGPHSNVLKFKPPMCFTIDNADLLISKLSVVLEEVERDLEEMDCELEDLSVEEVAVEKVRRMSIGLLELGTFSNRGITIPTV